MQVVAGPALTETPTMTKQTYMYTHSNPLATTHTHASTAIQETFFAQKFCTCTCQRLQKFNM